jgi:hypothetical protein
MRGSFVAALVSVALTTATAPARPNDDENPCARASTAQFELSPWGAVGGGARFANGDAPRAIGTLAAHAAITVPVARLFRAGVWTSPGTVDFRSFDASGGGRIEWHSNDADDAYFNLFGVGGRWTVLADLGGGHRFGAEGNRGEFFVARLAFGFTARNRLLHLYGSTPCHCATNDPNAEEKVCRPTLGLVSGARPFITVQHAIDGSRTEVTAGIEFELIGAGWWVGAAF